MRIECNEAVIYRTGDLRKILIMPETTQPIPVIPNESPVTESVPPSTASDGVHAAPIPTISGEISVPEALALFAALALIAFGLVLTLDKKVVQMSFVGVGLMATYPFLKRFFPAPQFFMGVAFSWSIPMAFVAQTGSTSKLCWL